MPTTHPLKKKNKNLRHNAPWTGVIFLLMFTAQRWTGRYYLSRRFLFLRARLSFPAYQKQSKPKKCHWLVKRRNRHLPKNENEKTDALMRRESQYDTCCRQIAHLCCRNAIIVDNTSARVRAGCSGDWGTVAAIDDYCLAGYFLATLLLLARPR